MQPESVLLDLAPLEVREASGDTPDRIQGLILPVGRVSIDRREVIVPGAVAFPSGGVRLLAEHLGRQILTFHPVEQPDGWHLDAPLPLTGIGREARELVSSGTRARLSVEMYVLNSAVVSGVREVRQTLVESAALCSAGSYDQTRAELRARRQVMFWV